MLWRNFFKLKSGTSIFSLRPKSRNFVQIDPGKLQKCLDRSNLAQIDPSWSRSVWFDPSWSRSIQLRTIARMLRTPTRLLSLKPLFQAWVAQHGSQCRSICELYRFAACFHTIVVLSLVGFVFPSKIWFVTLSLVTISDDCILHSNLNFLVIFLFQILVFCRAIPPECSSRHSLSTAVPRSLRCNRNHVKFELHTLSSVLFMRLHPWAEEVHSAFHHPLHTGTPTHNSTYVSKTGLSWSPLIWNQSLVNYRFFHVIL